MPEPDCAKRFPAHRFVCVPLNRPAFGSDDDPDAVFAVCDAGPGPANRVSYERASIHG